MDFIAAVTRAHGKPRLMPIIIEWPAPVDHLTLDADRVSHCPRSFMFKVPGVADRKEATAKAQVMLDEFNKSQERE